MRGSAARSAIPDSARTPSCGKLSRLVIDPRAGTVTHLVVNDRQFQGRLVPLDLADVDAAAGQIRVRCTIAEFEKLGPASMTVRQDNDADPEHSDDQLQWRSVASQLLADPPAITYDTLPFRWMLRFARGQGGHSYARDSVPVRALRMR